MMFRKLFNPKGLPYGIDKDKEWVKHSLMTLRKPVVVNGVEVGYILHNRNRRDFTLYDNKNKVRCCNKNLYHVRDFIKSRNDIFRDIAELTKKERQIQLEKAEAQKLRSEAAELRKEAALDKALSLQHKAEAERQEKEASKKLDQCEQMSTEVNRRLQQLKSIYRDNQTPVQDRDKLTER